MLNASGFLIDVLLSNSYSKPDLICHNFFNLFGNLDFFLLKTLNVFSLK